MTNMKKVRFESQKTAIFKKKKMIMKKGKKHKEEGEKEKSCNCCIHSPCFIIIPKSVAFYWLGLKATGRHSASGYLAVSFIYFLYYMTRTH
jgi:hypothetical protein